jgi:hypothetical protein
LSNPQVRGNLSMRIGLINTNLLQPPVAPIGLDYIAEALNAAGYSVSLLDLCWERDPAAAIVRFLNSADFLLIGMSLRNTDDCAYSSRQSFLPGFAKLAATVRENTDAPVIAGGVGFSVMPETILELAGLDAGLWGEGEFVFPTLAARLEKGEPWTDLPGLVLRHEEGWMRNPSSFGNPADLPLMTRRWADNVRYFRHGGQAGFETRRGCAAGCVFCADPVAKGRNVRLRPPAAVADEIEQLLRQGIDVLHTCDGEFNLPGTHAFDVCREIIRRGLGGRIRWYTYCSPAPFSRELARVMREAGCAGIDFGADHGCETMLKRLGRDFGPEDIRNATRWAKEEGMAVMLDLLLGAPGETREGIERTVKMVREAGPDLAGVSLGVRIFPGTKLAATLGGGDSVEPEFFLEPAIAADVYDWMNDCIGDDPRFLFFDPTKPAQNYNYNSNERLVEAIGKGYRGAFWDILRTYPGRVVPPESHLP